MKNEDAWKAIFEELKILAYLETNEYFKISAQSINKYREARLMAKFDYSANLPELFQNHHLIILPTSRGDYVIGRFDGYFKLNEQKRSIKPVIDYVECPAGLSISSLPIRSESQAINLAFCAGIFARIAGEVVYPTLTGRMTTGKFGFVIDNSKNGQQSSELKQIKIEVDNSQCEIDGCFEGAETAVLVEAKMEEPEDFNIRQLYYPYKYLRSQIPGKVIIPVLLCYSNDLIIIHQFKFEDDNHFNSIQHIKSLRFTTQPQDIQLKDIQQISHKLAQSLPFDSKIPFPQADKLNRVIDLITLVDNHPDSMLSNREITALYAFDQRQTAYYVAAGRFLGLLSAEKGTIELTPLATQLFSKPYKEKTLGVISQILANPVFRGVFEEHIRLNKQPSSDFIIDQILKYNKFKRTTAYRRSQTVSKWIEWIIEQTEP
jgi:hypothetical protein